MRYWIIFLILCFISIPVMGAFSGNCHWCNYNAPYCSDNEESCSNYSYTTQAQCENAIIYDNVSGYVFWYCQQQSGYTNCSTKNYGVCRYLRKCRYKPVGTCVVKQSYEIWSYRECTDKDGSYKFPSDLPAS